jgi:hypothetical protein
MINYAYGLFLVQLNGWLNVTNGKGEKMKVIKNPCLKLKQQTHPAIKSINIQDDKIYANLGYMITEISFCPFCGLPIEIEEVEDPKPQAFDPKRFVM